MNTNFMTTGKGRLFRFAFGIILTLVGCSLLVARLLNSLEVDSNILRALEAGGLCALATALGAVPVLVLRGLSSLVSSTLLGFGAGVMLAATAFSLIIPGIDAAQNLGMGKWSSSGLISAGILMGAFGLVIVDRKLSCSSGNTLLNSVGQPIIPARIWGFVIAIIGHNIPEGMAIGVSAGGGLPNAESLAFGIALQDIPEGLVVALVLAGAGLPRIKAFLVGAASGLVEPIAAAFSAWLLNISVVLLPFGLALAAGAMLLVVTHEIIPESHRNGHHLMASTGLCIGFCLMLMLDTALS